MDEEDNPPSYSDAMAAIAEGMRRQGIQTRDSFTPAEMSGSFSDVIVIFPPSRDRLSSSGSSFQIVDPSFSSLSSLSSFPSEPPPPYTEHTPPPSPSPTHSRHPQAASMVSTSVSSFSTSRNTSGSLSLPRYNTSPECVPKQPDYNVRTTAAPDSVQSDQELAVRGSRPSKTEPSFDPTLPARVTFEQPEYVISSSSSPSTDIKWTIPENADNFTGLLYVVEIHASCNPTLPIRPKCPFAQIMVDRDWLEVMDTSRPLIRVYHSPSSLIIGPAKWPIKDPLSLHNLKVTLRVRAVDGYNRLPSCKSGPWSDEVIVRYIDTTQITESQEKAFAKNRKSTSLTSSKKDSSPQETNKSLLARTLHYPALGHITLGKTDYHLGTDTSVQTYISWKMPSNIGCFAKVWYEVQCINSAPLALCLKGIGKDIDRLCGSDAPVSVGQLGAWMTIAEIQSASLRVQTLSDYLSIGQHKWDISNIDESLRIKLRIRPLGMRRSGIVTGPWSDVITIHYNEKEAKH